MAVEEKELLARLQELEEVTGYAFLEMLKRISNEPPEFQRKFCDYLRFIDISSMGEPGEALYIICSIISRRL